MKMFKYLAIAGLLFSLVDRVNAEDGHERAKRFNEHFRAEQARLWNDDRFDEKQQRVVQTRPAFHLKDSKQSAQNSTSEQRAD